MNIMILTAFAMNSLIFRIIYDDILLLESRSHGPLLATAQGQGSSVSLLGSNFQRVQSKRNPPEEA